MKKMTFRTIITVMAIISAAAVSGCTAGESKKADTETSSSESVVSAHETTEETKSAAISVLTYENTEKASGLASEEKNENLISEGEIDVSELSGAEIQSDTTGEEGASGEDEDPEDTSEDTEFYDDEEAGEYDENEAVALDEPIKIVGNPSPDEDGTYPCSTIIVSTAENTTDAMVQELISKYGLGIVYDYENLNMYAFSTPEPLAREAAEKLMDELKSYDFIISAEPDRIIKLDDPVMSDIGDIGLF